MHRSPVSSGLLSLLIAWALVACADDPTGSPEGVAERITRSGGDHQFAVVATSLSAPLEVRITDRSGNPVPGFQVHWQVTGGNGSIKARTALQSEFSMTDAQGIARADWTLGTIAGLNRVVACMGSCTNELGAARTEAFLATGTPGPVATLSLSATTLALTIAQTQRLSVAARDQFGNSISDPVQWKVTDETVARAAADGSITGLAVGATTVRVSLQGREASIPLLVVADLNAVLIFTVDNKLIYPISIEVNTSSGSIGGMVPAAAAGVFSLPKSTTLALRWTMIRPIGADGQPLGVALAGSFPTVSNPESGNTFEVNNMVRGQPYFAPLVVNSSIYTVDVTVTIGEGSGVGGAGQVAAATTGTVGYYELHPQSEINVFRHKIDTGWPRWGFSHFSTLVPVGAGTYRVAI